MSIKMEGKFEAALSRIDAMILKLQQPYSQPLNVPLYPIVHRNPSIEVSNPNFSPFNSRVESDKRIRRSEKLEVAKKLDNLEDDEESSEGDDEYHCNLCLSSCSYKRYQCSKLFDYNLCFNCFGSKRFEEGLTPQDFILIEDNERANNSIVVDEVSVSDVVTIGKNRDRVVGNSLLNLEVEDYRSEKSSKVFDEMPNPEIEKNSASKDNRLMTVQPSIEESEGKVTEVLNVGKEEAIRFAQSRRHILPILHSIYPQNFDATDVLDGNVTALRAQKKDQEQLLKCSRESKVRGGKLLLDGWPPPVHSNVSVKKGAVLMIKPIDDKNLTILHTKEQTAKLQIQITTMASTVIAFNFNKTIIDNKKLKYDVDKAINELIEDIDTFHEQNFEQAVEHIHENEQGIFEQVLRGELDFSSDPWPRISESAKDLIRKMLIRDSKKRLTAHQVLCHPWVQVDGEAPDKPLDSAVLTRLKQFSAMHKLKKMALRVIAESLSEDEIAGLKEMFKMMDADNSGHITLEELKFGLERAGANLKEVEISALMEAADFDNSGTIDYGEFLAATLHLNKIEKEDNLFAAFSYFDKDGSGYITQDELQQACKEFGIEAVRLEEMILEADHDNILDERVMNLYVLALELSIELYAGLVPNLSFTDNTIGDMRESGSAANGLSFYSCIRSLTCEILKHQIGRVVSFFRLNSHGLDSLSGAETLDNCIAYIKGNQHFTDEEFREEACSILNYLVKEILQWENKLSHEDGNGIQEEIWCLAAVLRLMSSSLLQIVWLLRRNGYPGRPKISNSICKEYDFVSGIISRFLNFLSVSLGTSSFFKGGGVVRVQIICNGGRSCD